MLPSLILFIAFAIPGSAFAAERINILDFAPAGKQVDRAGVEDASDALIGAISAANKVTISGNPVCIYIPAGRYLIKHNPPPFIKAGCIVGDGSSQSILMLDKSYSGDFLTWSESWAPTTPGPRIVGLSIDGVKGTTNMQNAIVFYDRNDNVFMDDISIANIHGRALYSGVRKNATRAYMRESHLRSLRFFSDGADDAPVVEFSSSGPENTDASNEIRISQMDIYDSKSEGLAITNNGSGSVRYISIDQLRIEGGEDGNSKGDLLLIKNNAGTGSVNNIVISNVELLDPYRGFSGLHVTAEHLASVPYEIFTSGSIGGGLPHGSGINAEAVRSSEFHFYAMNTEASNLIIGDRFDDVLIDGGGHEKCWSILDLHSRISALRVPSYRTFEMKGGGSNFHPYNCRR